MPWVEIILDGMWRGAIAVVPLALLTAGICRCLKYRPGARHGLWLITLLALVVAPFLPSVTGARSELGDVAAIPADSNTQDESMRMPDDGPIELELLDLRSLAADSMDLRDNPVEPSIGQAAESTGGFVQSHNQFRNHSRNEASEQPPNLENLLGNQLSCDLEGTSRSNALASQSGSILTDSILTDVRRNETQAANKACETQECQTSGSGASAELAELVKGVDQTQVAGLSNHSIESTSSDSRSDSSSDSFWRRHLPTLLATWRNWIDQFTAARDALGRISPIPGSLWFFGALSFALIHWFNAMRLARQLKHAVIAPPDVRRLVFRIAHTFKLKRVPECVIVNRRISPMIWCGWRQRLVLPAYLWNELDAEGRVAVVTHELAHLRRRDHWVRWIDLVVGCVYWWHPIAWWVRSRIGAESENCCDAWVTWLNPKSRRAYAEALLAARQFISSDVYAAPALGMGAGARKSKNFARRLTMIMTRKDAPGMSVTDLAFAMAVVCAGWLAIPAQSGAAEPPEGDGAYAVVASDDGVITVGAAPSQAQEMGAVVAAQSVSADAPHVHGHAAGHGHASSDQNQDLEHRLGRLEQQMARLMDLMESRSSSSGRGIVTQQSANGPKQPTFPKPPTPPGIQSQVPQRFFNSTTSRTPGVKFKKSYSLSAGKLEALTALMARDDVPVVISPGKDSITVNGTAAQHGIFSRFVEVIGDESRKSVKISGGKLEALSALMIRNDVPVRVAPGDNQIEVIGSPAEQQAVTDFIKMINGEQVTWRSRYGKTLGKAESWLKGGQLAELDYYNRAGNVLQKAKRNKADVRSRLIRAERDELRKQLRQLRGQVQSLQTHREALEENADQMREQADQLREKMERSREQIENLRERTNKSDAKSNPEIRERLVAGQYAIASLQRQLEQAAAQADAQDIQGDALDFEIDKLEEQADELENREDELEDMAVWGQKEIEFFADVFEPVES